MRIAPLTAVMISLVAATAAAQTSAPSSSPSAAPTTAPSPGATPGATPGTGAPGLAPTPGTPAPGGVTQAPPPAINSTPSGANTDLYPSTRVLPNPAPSAATPNATAPTDQTPPPSGGRPQPGGANGLRQPETPTRTGRNPTDYSVADCMKMWEAATHMSKREWKGACTRVQNRLENLHADGSDPQMKTNAKRRQGSASAGASGE
jgi:hypothetical protein